MKFLIDEDIPVKLLKTLINTGHDAVRVQASSKDPDVARQAVQENRILITLDKDFADRLRYSPSTHTIICIRIHPPFADALIVAMLHLLDDIPENELKGLIVLRSDGHVRITG